MRPIIFKESLSQALSMTSHSCMFKSSTSSQKQELLDLKMPIHKTLFELILILWCLSSTSEASTAYDLLEEYGFPKGILPQGVQSFQLRTDGSFEVHLGEDCEFKVQDSSYVLRYESTVTGTLASGSIKNLRGVSVKVLFFWFSIDEVVRDGNSLVFHVGLLSAAFPVSNFEDCPKCGCGFDCDSGFVHDS